jgi:hypothetical protein
MKVVLLGGNREPWSAHQRPHEEKYMNGIEAWVYAFGGDYRCAKFFTEKEMHEYDIIIADSHYISRLASLCMHRKSHTKWVTMIEGNASDYLIPNPDLQKLLNASDLVNTINTHTTGFFRNLTTAPVEFIGIPHPWKNLQELQIPIEQRRKAIFCCGHLRKRCNDVLAAQGLGAELYGYELRHSRKIKKLFQEFINTGKIHLNTSYYKDLAISLYSRMQLKNTVQVRYGTYLELFFKENADALLWMNLDERFTWARYILDGAALGIPVISTDSTGHQSRIFPDLLVKNEFAIDQAREYAQRLLQDRKFYIDIIQKAQENLEWFGPKPTCQRLLNALHL